MAKIHDEYFPEFEALGETEVRRRLACHDFHITHKEPAEAWLIVKEVESKKRAELREEESLSISSKALAISEAANLLAAKAITNSRNANIWAAIAALIAVIAIIL